MRRMRLVGLALVAVFALGAVASSAALAGEGPIWQVNKAKLEEGFAKNITGEKKTGTAEFKLKATGLITINCSTVTSTGTINGGTPGTDLAKVTFSGCSVEGKSSTECHVNSPGEAQGTIFTEAKTEIVYLSETSATNKKVDATGAGKVLGDLFSPPTGSVFVTLETGGTNCPAFTNGTNKVEGNVVAEIEPSEAEATSGTLKFPTTAIKHYWTRAGGVAVEHTAALNVFNIFNCIQSGQETVKLESGEEFGAWL